MRNETEIKWVYMSAASPLVTQVKRRIDGMLGRYIFDTPSRAILAGVAEGYGIHDEQRGACAAVPVRIVGSSTKDPNIIMVEYWPEGT